MTIAPGNHHHPDTDVLATVELEVALLLRRADQVSRSQAVSGLDRSAYLVLRVLDTAGPLGVTAIADHLGLDASTVTRQVIALEKAGHATRRRDDTDRRVVVVDPTDAGLAAYTAHRTVRADLYAGILDDWSDDDRTHLAELLHRLNNDIDRHRAAPKH